MSPHATSTYPLNTSRNGESTTCLLQCLTTVFVKKCFLISNNFFCQDLMSLPFIYCSVISPAFVSKSISIWEGREIYWGDISFEREEMFNKGWALGWRFSINNCHERRKGTQPSMNAFQVWEVVVQNTLGWHRWV